MLKPVNFLIISSLILLLVTTASCSKKPYNPFLDLKEKPSERMSKANKRHIKKGNRAYRKSQGRSRKHLFGRKKAPGQ